MSTMETFIINGKTYQAKDLDFEFLVVLDKNKVSINDISSISAMNTYFAYCSGLDESQAAKEISAHIIKGGKLDDMGSVYTQKVTESDFFRALMEQNKDQTTAETIDSDTEETPKKKTKRSATN